MSPLRIFIRGPPGSAVELVASEKPPQARPQGAGVPEGTSATENAAWGGFAAATSPRVLPGGPLQHLGGKGDDLHETPFAELACNRTEDTSAPRLHLVIDDDHGVVVEPYVRTVAAPAFLRRSHYNRSHDVRFLHRSPRNGVFDRAHDDVPDARISASGPTEHLDDQPFSRSGVICDTASRLLLDHFALSTISTRRQRLVFDRGRVSMMRTVSPTFASFSSSCTLS